MYFISISISIKICMLLIMQIIFTRSQMILTKSHNCHNLWIMICTLLLLLLLLFFFLRKTIRTHESSQTHSINVSQTHKLSHFHKSQTHSPKLHILALKVKWTITLFLMLADYIRPVLPLRMKFTKPYKSILPPRMKLPNLISPAYIQSFNFYFSIWMTCKEFKLIL